jgi:hypothetical protein
MLSSSKINNKKVQISIVEVNDRKVIVYLKIAGIYETGKRVFSDEVFLKKTSILSRKIKLKEDKRYVL